MSEKKDLFQIRKEIGLRLRQVRKEMGYTQGELAQLLKVNRSHLSRLERGEKSLPPPVLYLLSDNFHVSLDWLITGLGEIFKKKNLLLFREEETRKPIRMRLVDENNIS
jgi:transcriptional regulator with XRE-family HTH domain